MKKMKLFALATGLAAMTLLAACSKKQETPTTTAVAQTTAAVETIQEEEQENIEESESTSEKELKVVDYCLYEDEYKDDVDNHYHYFYRLPYIEGDTPYIQEINAAIKEIDNEQIQPQLKEMEDGYSLYLIECNYFVGHKDDITSVFLKISTDYDDVILYCWNLHNDGTIAENKEIFEAYALTSDEFVETARELAEEYVNYGTTSEEFKRLHDMTLESVHENMPVFIGENQGLNCIIGVYTPAGGGYYEEVCEIPGTANEEDDPGCGDESGSYVDEDGNTTIIGTYYYHLTPLANDEESGNPKEWELKIEAGINQTIPISIDEGSNYYPPDGTGVMYEVDANFDGKMDLMIYRGSFGAQSVAYYDCYLNRDDHFERVNGFDEIPEPVIDDENKVILGHIRDGAECYYEYEYQIEGKKAVEISETIFKYDEEEQGYLPSKE